MHCVVAAGTGCIGSWVVRRLCERGHHVTVIHRGKTESELPADVDHIHSEVIPGLDCDVALHMYAMTERDARDFVAAFSRRAQRLLVASSGDVYRAYGILRGKEAPGLHAGPLAEDAPLRSVLYPYEEWPEYDKIPVERVLMEAGRRNCVLRLPAVYGPGDSHHRAGALLKPMTRAGAPYRIGETYARWRWTHCYVEDVAHAIALAMVDERSAGRIYNIGEAQTPTMGDRIERIGRAFGWRGEMIVGTDDVPFDCRQHLMMDSSRIRSELGFAETVSEEEALQRTIAWEIDSGYVSRLS